MKQFFIERTTTSRTLFKLIVSRMVQQIRPANWTCITYLWCTIGNEVQGNSSGQFYSCECSEHRRIREVWSRRRACGIFRGEQLSRNLHFAWVRFAGIG